MKQPIPMSWRFAKLPEELRAGAAEEAASRTPVREYKATPRPTPARLSVPCWDQLSWHREDCRRSIWHEHWTVVSEPATENGASCFGRGAHALGSGFRCCSVLPTDEVTAWLAVA
ncbi:hypothetical protein NDU88_004974 [Pleurodeles waltl]|uniref:Uncharacterized protein n=1 Tax=Pleurodeles waltl TaxID=8319 RepID=A0AAV7RK98_PLEWA|nr:hypothetical protein NDU88_004974 [Pleurodeles waltl]